MAVAVSLPKQGSISFSVGLPGCWCSTSASAQSVLRRLSCRVGQAHSLRFTLCGCFELKKSDMKPKLKRVQGQLKI